MRLLHSKTFFFFSSFETRAGRFRHRLSDMNAISAPFLQTRREVFQRAPLATYPTVVPASETSGPKYATTHSFSNRDGHRPAYGPGRYGGVGALRATIQQPARRGPDALIAGKENVIEGIFGTLEEVNSALADQAAGQSDRAKPTSVDPPLFNDLLGIRSPSA